MKVSEALARVVIPSATGSQCDSPHWECVIALIESWCNSHMDSHLPPLCGMRMMQRIPAMLIDS